MNNQNTSPLLYVDDSSVKEKPSQEEILMNEDDILQGLIDLENSINEEKNYRNIQIRRNGELKLAFRIRPVSEKDNQACWKMATRYAPTKPGKPKVAIETDPAKYRSCLIYTATVDEDRQKIWDNKQAQLKFNVFRGEDMIDLVLLAGEKNRIIEVIDEISGFDDNFNNISDTAKN